MGKVNQLILKDDSLSAVTGDNLFAESISFIDDIESDIEINLQEVKFVDPYGLVILCLVSRYLKNRCKNLSIILPNSFDCQAYLCATNLVSLIGTFSEIKNIMPGVVRQQSLNQEIVLELTKINKKEIGQSEDIKNVLERLGIILRNQLNFDEKVTADLTNIVSELCYNIKDHSEDEGFVVVQRYQRTDGKRFVVIGVGDLGVGIKASLGRRYDVSGWSHLDAIVQALKKEFSAFPNRGFGLYMISKIIKDYEGALHIRSGDTRLYLKHNPRGTETVLFPGTQVSISLSN